MKAEFSHKGVDYVVRGTLLQADGDDDSILVRRLDGQEIPGVTTHQGMVQLGIPKDIERAAYSALRREHRKR